MTSNISDFVARNHLKVPEVRRLGHLLGILEPYRMKKSTLINEIAHRVHAQRTSLYPDWQQRFLDHAPIKRYSFDPNKDYSLAELQQIYSAVSRGKGGTHVRREELRRRIIAEIEKQEHSSNESSSRTAYNSVVQRPTSNLTVAHFSDIPADATSIAGAINQTLSTIQLDEKHEIYVSANIEFDVSYFGRNPDMSLEESRNLREGIPIEYRRIRYGYRGITRT